MKKLFLLLVFLPLEAWAACTGSSPLWTSTPDYTSVNSCVTSASDGDTINVTAGDGTETWSSQLSVTKEISIIGPGKASLTITSAYSNNNSGLIFYDPASPSATYVFRVSGFTFDLNHSSGGIWMDLEGTTPASKVRVDNCAFDNISGRPISTQGPFYGVIDNNTFNDVNIGTASYSNNATDWTNFTFSLGSADNLYYEDNSYTNVNYIPHAGGVGGRYVARYETYDTYSTNTLNIEIHGNQQAANHSGMGWEVYGTKVIRSNTGQSWDYTQRGGSGAIFYNSVDSDYPYGGINLREEYDDAYNLPATASDGQPQRISDTYIWNVRNDLTGSLRSLKIDDDYFNKTTLTVNSPLVLVENQAFWLGRAAAFDGTIATIGSCGYWESATDTTNQCTKSGIGCGTLAARPATCTTGVAYWATDQSCTDLTDYVGANATTPISGTLYKCTSTDTWASYYVPYTYPHPLRSEACDMDGDTDLDSADTVYLVDVIQGNETSSKGDLNGDSLRNILDVMLLNYVVNGYMECP